MRFPTSFALLAVVCACTFACADRDASADATGGGADPPAVERIAGTPEGDLEKWVADIRSGLAPIVDLTQQASAVEKVAVDLYVNRQEWLERYYGTYGSLTGDTASALGQAVMNAETRFHELLILLAGPSPTRNSVQAAVDSLDAAYGIVLREARTRPARIPEIGQTGAPNPTNR